MEGIAMTAVRRLRAGLRGWGGVGAMAVVCALAVVFALLLPRDADARRRRHGHRAARASPEGTQARADDCRGRPAEPEPRPSSGAAGDDDRADQGRRTAADRRRRPEQLPLGLPRPEQHATTQLEGFDIDLVHRIAEDILGDPNAVQFKAIPTSQRIPAIQDGRGRHGGPHHDDQLRPHEGSRVLRRRTSGPASRSWPPRPRRSTATTRRWRTRGSARRRAPPRYDAAGGGPEGRRAAPPPPTSDRRPQPARLPGAAPARPGRRRGHRQRPRREPGRAGPDGGAEGRAVHHRVLRRGDEARTRTIWYAGSTRSWRTTARTAAGRTRTTRGCPPTHGGRTRRSPRPPSPQQYRD